MLVVDGLDVGHALHDTFFDVLALADGFLESLPQGDDVAPDRHELAERRSFRGQGCVESHHLLTHGEGALGRAGQDMYVWHRLSLGRVVDHGADRFSERGLSIRDGLRLNHHAIRFGVFGDALWRGLHDRGGTVEQR